MIKLTFVNGHHIVDSVKYGSPSTWGAIDGDINEQRDLSLLLDNVKQDNADTREQLSTKADKEHTHLLKDITDYEAPDLSTYATKEEIPSLNGYATEDWVTNKNYLTQHQSLEDYYTKTEVDTKLNDVSGVTNVALNNYYTKTESDDKYALKTSIPSLNGYATEEWVNSKGFLTTHQSLADYAKKTDIPNMDGYATNEQLSTKQDKGDYALKSDIKPIPSVLSAFNNDVGYLTTHQDLTPYAKKTDIPSLEGYATKQWVTDKNYLTQHQSLEDYYTKSEVDNKFKNFSGGTSTDLTKYYTKVESDGKYATKEEIPSLNGYATEQWVTNKGYLTSHQDLTDYARKAEIKTVNGHSLIGSGDIQIEVGSSVDLSNYYTKTESDGKYALKTSIPSLNGYATEQWVTNKGYLTQHQSLENYYTKSEVDNKGYLTEHNPIDQEFSTTSENAVSNKLITIRLNEIERVLEELKKSSGGTTPPTPPSPTTYTLTITSSASDGASITPTYTVKSGDTSSSTTATTLTFNSGTTVEVTPSKIDGYTTPNAQTVTMDSDKQMTFTYQKETVVEPTSTVVNLKYKTTEENQEVKLMLWDTTIYNVTADGVNVRTPDFPQMEIKYTFPNIGEHVVTYEVKKGREQNAFNSGTFNGCDSLTSIEIPSGVTTIGENAFNECTSLSSITIPNTVTSMGNYAFYSCSSLSSITIPNTVTSIGESAFGSCTSLSDVTIESTTKLDYTDSFDSIDSNAVLHVPRELVDAYKADSSWTNAFGGGIVAIGETPTQLTVVNLKYKTTEANQHVTLMSRYNKSIKKFTVDGIDVTLPTTNGEPLSYFIPSSGEHVATYDVENGKEQDAFNDRLFGSCKNLTSIDIPSGVTSISHGVFYSCESLTSVTIPNTVTSIGESAFYNCSSLTSIVIPNSVLTIGNTAFMYCTNLENVVFSDHLQSIGKQAFYQCEKLTDFKVYGYNVAKQYPLTTVGEQAFAYCNSLPKYPLPYGVTTIGNGAFEDCMSIQSLLVPNGVTRAEQNLYNGCTGATDINITQSVQYIGKGTFAGCTSVTAVTIPSGVTEIDMNAFQYCSKLADVTIESPTKLTYNQGAFERIASNAVLHVPSDLVSEYQNEYGWSNSFQGGIEPMFEVEIGDGEF